jgi:hypothetical protein
MVLALIGLWLAVGVYGLAICRLASRPTPVPPRRRDVEQLAVGGREATTLVDPGGPPEADAGDPEERLDGYYITNFFI